MTLTNSPLRLLVSRQFLNHRPLSAHPENPERLVPLLQALEAKPELKNLILEPKTSASREILLRAHAKDMVDRILDQKGKTGWLDTDTYHSEKSVETALLAAGSTIEMAMSIWKNEYRRGFSFIRPPGHHATREEAMGFCLFNNVALAVAAIKAETPQARLAIVDFDLHHGNGTQWIFYDDPNILFVSSHRFPFYPGTGALEEIGSGKATGTKVNFPLGERYPDALFQTLYGSLVPSILKEFAPDMLFVSAGFDGHIDDPMMGFQIHTETYREIARNLIQVAEQASHGKILFCLEGGYNPYALRDSAMAVIEELQVPQAITRGLPSSYASEIDKFQLYFKKYFSL
jgi:acetoin utilization deacetylase AcuC-like enzyme